MVGTAQADNFTVFIRKIGYSVGLEYLLQRAAGFGRAYASVASFRESDWDQLVRSEWGLKSSNIADVFGALDIARIQNREVYPGPTGEVLGILCKLNPDGPSQRSVDLAVATAIVRSDGDIFLNSLQAAFEEEATKVLLLRMIQSKREALFGVFTNPRERQAVSKAVSIERQKANRGSSSGGGLDALTRRASLDSTTQRFGLPRSTDIYEIEAPSNDYLRKITASRKGWAESLGLFSKGVITEAGNHFLLSLAEGGCAGPDGAFNVWPTLFELESNQFRPESFRGLGIMTSGELQALLFRSLGGDHREAVLDVEQMAGKIAEIYGAYRNLSQHRSMIRNEVSSTIVSQVIACDALAKGGRIPNLESVWNSDMSRYGITVRRSKTIEYAITVRQDARKTS